MKKEKWYKCPRCKEIVGEKDMIITSNTNLCIWCYKDLGHLDMEYELGRLEYLSDSGSLGFPER